MKIDSINRRFRIGKKIRIGSLCSVVFCFLNRKPVVAGIASALFVNAAQADPAYVQGNYAVPQAPQATVTVPYTAAQTAGNLNVVIVGWNNSTSQVMSVADSKGNAYQRVVGPTMTGSRSQSIYYANNISGATAAANVVTTTFSTAADYPDIRVLEYSGIDPVNPVDAFAGSIGNSATSSTALVTTNAKDLLVAANTVQTLTYQPGSGFTRRLLTSPDGDTVEDGLVTTAGTYADGTSLTLPGEWVMQMVAFRAGGSTSTPSITLAWDADAATSDSGTNAVGYVFYSGNLSREYTQRIVIGNTTTTNVSNLASGSTYFFAVAAYNAAGIESPPSNEISFRAP